MKNTTIKAITIAMLFTVCNTMNLHAETKEEFEAVMTEYAGELEKSRQQAEAETNPVKKAVMYQAIMEEGAAGQQMIEEAAEAHPEWVD